MNTHSFELDTSRLADLALRLELDHDSLELDPFLDLQSRDSYLLWVTLWKESYRSVSEQIREIKREIKATYGSVNERHIGPSWSQLCERERLRALARAMLVLRKRGKVLSWARAREVRETIS